MNNCYTCVHRGSVPGDCHSACHHPSATGDFIMISLLSMIQFGVYEYNGMLVVGDRHGINNGWFNWPMNFDPTWLKSCTGYTENAA